MPVNVNSSGANLIVLAFYESNLRYGKCFCRSNPLLEVQHWLKTVPALNLEPVKCGSISLDEPVVEALEEAVQQTKVHVKELLNAHY